MGKTIKIETREWFPGDLVNINKCDRNGNTYTSIGVVIYEVDAKENQTRIFPAVLVFDVSIGGLSEYYIYELELVSPAS